MCEIIMENQGTLVSIYSDVYFVTKLYELKNTHRRIKKGSMHDKYTLPTFGEKQL